MARIYNYNCCGYILIYAVAPICRRQKAHFGDECVIALLYKVCGRKDIILPQAEEGETSCPTTRSAAWLCPKKRRFPTTFKHFSTSCAPSLGSCQTSTGRIACARSSCVALLHYTIRL